MQRLSNDIKQKYGKGPSTRSIPYPTISIVQRFRLRGVDAMEIGTHEGKQAKHALTELLLNQTQITAHTWHTDLYGRYIADLVTQDGTYINKQLVEKKHARFLAPQPPKFWQHDR